MPRLLLSVCLFLAGDAPAQKPLKVFISVDMEGIDNVVGTGQLGPGQFEYERFRELMTQEVNAAARAAFDAGAQEVVVADSHGNAMNVLADRLDSRVRLVRGWPRPLLMMDPIDASFSAAIFVGYHAREGSELGVLEHTMSSRDIYDLRLNGVSVPEAGFSAAIAGDFGVPVVLVAGDQTITAQARQLLGNIEVAQVKRAISRTAAESLTPEAAQKLIAERTRAALSRLAEFKPYRVSHPVTMEIAFKSTRSPELIAYLPGVKRVDGHTISFAGKDMTEVTKFLSFLMTYSGPI